MTDYTMPDPPNGGGEWRWKISKSPVGGSTFGFANLKLQSKSLGIWWTVDGTTVILDGTPEENAEECCDAARYVLERYTRRSRTLTKIDVNGLEGAVHGHGITGSKHD
ncbi:hypothetical protein SEA_BRUTONGASTER_90 [Gordonia phage BrutonGaster]|uniref:Uncharacterized protein n=1 Tax=Gordonia phage BrutonGaster TaxID=2530116 RepID=A0A482JH95_9CAUD|nr:hypothetical protein HOV26_gp092 [Gordonia phage BrutonGaster]QBP33305.1 hypothetical protein SEA_BRUTONGASTER_90 [Gordonia phage BrutonGaster]